jgi:hypothetical protein
MPVYRRHDRYPMVRLESVRDWDALLALCDGHLHPHRLDQFRALLGAECKTVVVERDYVCKDYRDTYANYIFLTTSRGYKAERRTSLLPHGLSRLYTRLPMPKFIWVAELSTKELYPAGKILGEIIWDATASDEDFFSWLVIHYPERLLVNDRASDIAGITERAFAPPEPYELYRHNLHQIA